MRMSALLQMLQILRLLLLVVERTSSSSSSMMSNRQCWYASLLVKFELLHARISLYTYVLLWQQGGGCHYARYSAQY
jgi:hypothetical protein